MANSFLVIKTSAIGDIIHALPVVDYLRQKIPGAKIDWVAEPAGSGLLAAHPHIRRVMRIDTKRWRKNLWRGVTWQEMAQFRQELASVTYDLVFDLQGNTKSALITALARGKEKVGFGWNSVAEKPNLLATHRRIEVPDHLPVVSRYLSLVQTYFKDPQPFSPQELQLKLTAEETKRLQALDPFPRPRYMVAFGSHWRNKTLSEEVLTGFLRRLDAFFVFVWGNEKEKNIADQLHTTFANRSITVGSLTLPLWQAMMREMDLVIAMDSAALHLCATTNTPSFSLFGPTQAAVFKPLGHQHGYLQGKCPYGREFVRRCPILRTCPTGACMRNLSADEIFHAFKKSSTA
jgi:heptosyltransferase-1